jgi:hypothetical protein
MASDGCVPFDSTYFLITLLLISIGNILGSHKYDVKGCIYK